MCRQLRRELRLEYMRMDIVEARNFVESLYLPQWILWLTRSAMACVCLGTLLYTAVETPVFHFSSSGGSTSNLSSNDSGGAAKPSCAMKGQFFLSYLTVWSYIVILLYFCSALFNMAMTRCETQQDALSTADVIRLRCQWLLCGVGCNAAAIVTVVYTCVLRPAMGRCHSNMPEAVDILVHVCNLIFMIAEVAISSMVVHPVHCVFTAAYGLVYMLFSVLYWVPDHTRVMYIVILDWNRPLIPLLVFLAVVLVIVPAVHLMWWLVYLLRLRLVTMQHGSDSLGRYQPVRAD